MNKKVSNGFVLFAVLIFMQIFSLLGIYSLTTVSMKIKIAQHWRRKTMHIQMARRILRHIEDSVLTESAACVIPVISTTELVKKPASWWRQFSCGGMLMGRQYYYVSEFLGSDGCAVIQKTTTGQQVVSEYYRITLLYFSDPVNDRKLFFQSTVAKESNERSSCGQPRIVTMGPQMQREITRDYRA